MMTVVIAGFLAVTGIITTIVRLVARKTAWPFAVGTLALCLGSSSWARSPTPQQSVGHLAALGHDLLHDGVEGRSERKADIVVMKIAISRNSSSVISSLPRCGVHLISARSGRPRAVTTDNVMIRLSRMDSPGLLQMSANR